MIELSTRVFEVLRKDEDFILYRGRRNGDAPQAAIASRLRQVTARPDSSEMQSAGCGHDEALAESGYGAPSDLGRDAVSGFGRDEASPSRVLVLSPALEYPTPEISQRLEHEYSLREDLDSMWAARPIEIARHWDRPVSVLEDPGGRPLDQLLGNALDLALKSTASAWSYRSVVLLLKVTGDGSGPC